MIMPFKPITINLLKKKASICFLKQDMIAYNRKHKIAALNQQQLDANFDILYVLINLCIQFGHKHQ